MHSLGQSSSSCLLLAHCSPLPRPDQCDANTTRDCIGIAKTGSGKTLAFVLPLMRHVKDQPPVGMGDGPVGLLMAPTRELVQQISKVRLLQRQAPQRNC